MKSRGIRILDSEENIVSVKLIDILELITQGSSFYWGILDMYLMYVEEVGDFVVSLEKEVENSSEYLSVSWNKLLKFSRKKYQAIDLLVLGCKDDFFYISMKMK